MLSCRMTGGIVAAALSLVLIVGCSDRSDPVGPASELSAKANDAPAPAPLVTVDVGGESLTFWPFTSSNLATPDDPVNLIFTGQANPQQLRSALMGLDGDRTMFGFPDAFPFNCTWTDALGGTMQGAYAEPGGWEGSVVQLECGAYDPLRFHVRLVRHGRRDGRECALRAADSRHARAPGPPLGAGRAVGGHRLPAVGAARSGWSAHVDTGHQPGAVAGDSGHDLQPAAGRPEGADRWPADRHRSPCRS